VLRKGNEKRRTEKKQTKTKKKNARVRVYNFISNTGESKKAKSQKLDQRAKEIRVGASLLAYEKSRR
jgi:hypothetical protein